MIATSDAKTELWTVSRDVLPFIVKGKSKSEDLYSPLATDDHEAAELVIQDP